MGLYGFLGPFQNVSEVLQEISGAFKQFLVVFRSISGSLGKCQGHCRGESREVSEFQGFQNHFRYFRGILVVC